MKKENLKKEMYLKDKSSGTYFKVKTIGTNIVCDVFGEAHFLNNIEDLNKKETNDAKSFVSSIQARIEWMKITGVKAGDFVVARTERADGTEGYIIAGVIENPYRVLNGKVVTDFILSMGPAGLKVEEGVSVPLIEIRINDNIDLLMRFVEKIPEQFKALKHIGELFDEYDKNKWRMDLLKAKQRDILAVEFTTTTSIGILNKYVKLCSEDGCYLQMWYFMDGGIIKPDYDVIVGDYIKVRPATEEEKKHYANKLMGFSKVFPLDKVGRGEFKEEYLPKTDITPTEINKDSWDEKEILKTPSEDQTQLADRPKTGYKNDRLDDKLRWELLPWQEIEDIVKVYHFGAKKYAPESWKNLNDGARRYFAACNRHLIAYIKGEKIDPESGIYHLAHAAWNVIAMLYLDKHGNGFDFDRVKTDKFIEKACIVHNNKYKYPNTIYVKNDEKVEIECPIHGTFWQTPHNHLNGAGCPKCRNGIAKRFICGSGVNDLNSARNERSYNIWIHLMKRCCGERRPKAYKDCKICDEWKLYSNFKKFYDKYCKNDSFHLDKDILVQGNKLYSPDTCVFVPREINETMHSIWVEDRSLPAGVSMTECGKFRARCRKGEWLDQEHIGCYDTAEEAFEEYRKAKKDRIKEMADRHFRNGDIDKKVYDALISYKIYPFPFGDKRNDDYLINEKKIF